MLNSYDLKNPAVVAVTPAMIEGSGLKKLFDKISQNTFDVELPSSTR